jgi:hypothetical protein
MEIVTAIATDGDPGNGNDTSVDYIALDARWISGADRAF